MTFTSLNNHGQRGRSEGKEGNPSCSDGRGEKGFFIREKKKGAIINNTKKWPKGKEGGDGRFTDTCTLMMGGGKEGGFLFEFSSAAIGERKKNGRVDEGESKLSH